MSSHYKKNVSIDKLTVLTWNVWFDSLAQEQRYNFILNYVESVKPDIICFQEVTEPFLNELGRHSKILEEYDISDDLTGRTIDPYGVMTLAKKELQANFSFTDFPSRMARKLLVASFEDASSGSIAIGNVHLESLATHPTREAQLAISGKVLKSFDQAILVGDFNFCSYRNYRGGTLPLENDSLKRILPTWTDLWPVMHPSIESDPGYTFEGGVNPFCKPDETMRYDRICFDFTRYNRWVPIAMDRVNMAVIPGIFDSGTETKAPSPLDSPKPRERPLTVLFRRESVTLYPSDHYGLIATFQKQS